MKDPFDFRGTSRERDIYEIEIPHEYKVDDVPIQSRST